MWACTNSNTIRSTIGRWGSIKSKTSAGRSTLCLCKNPIVGSYPSDAICIRTDFRAPHKRSSKLRSGAEWHFGLSQLDSFQTCADQPGANLLEWGGARAPSNATAVNATRQSTSTLPAPLCPATRRLIGEACLSATPIPRGDDVVVSAPSYRRIVPQCRKQSVWSQSRQQFQVPPQQMAIMYLTNTTKNPIF